MVVEIEIISIIGNTYTEMAAAVLLEILMGLLLPLLAILNVETGT